ncbi:MAG: hypothetical protein CMF49_06730 [Legionellales bacterium]|nr:hypothetical protein [Legionellales bacterium]|tara:strand:- start:48 stop:698 length:651 start_codon:yes stop_codon:yes gene_type:complete
MSDFINDQDRAEAIKAWIMKYGTTIFIAIIIGIALMYGNQYLQKKELQTKEEASMAFEQLLVSSDNKNIKQYQAEAQSLVSNFPKTAYADLASFLLAKSYVENKQYKNAISQLNWVITHSKYSEFKQVAAIRMARIYLYLKDYTKASASLAKVYDKTYNVMIDQIKGDIVLAQGNVGKARSLYTKASNDNVNSEILQPLLTVKLHSLPAQISNEAN